MSHALIIIAKNGYQDQELAGTRSGLLEKGYDITLASTSAGPCHGKFGGEEEAMISLKDVQIENYEKIAFIGGPGATTLADDPDAQRVVREAVAARKPLGAICIAPMILAKAGVLQSKKATVWNTGGTQAALLREYGAEYTGDLVTVDGMIVTANSPSSAEEFGKVLSTMPHVPL